MHYRSTLLCIPVVALFLAVAGNASAAPGSCELFASPTGSDAAAGTASAPVQTVSRLAHILRPGQVGCLRAGAYQGEGETYKELKISTPGITIASAPGEVAEIDARIWIAQGADGVTFERLLMEGANSRDLPSPTVNADDASFREDEVTNGHTTICFDLGNVTFGKAIGTVIEDSVVHACGEMPSTNQEHGIYLSDAENTVIRRNWIYDNVDRGIQLYPDAQNTLITENVIYGNGEGIIFSGNDEVAASGSVVTHNLIADSQIRRNVESSYPEGGPHGVDNEVRENCISGAPSAYYAGRGGSGIQEPELGFTASDNVTAAPQFVNAAAGDLQLASDSACGSMLGVVAALQPGPPGVGPVAPILPIIPPVSVGGSPEAGSAPVTPETIPTANAPTKPAAGTSAVTAAKSGDGASKSIANGGVVIAAVSGAKPVQQAHRRRHGKVTPKRSADRRRVLRRQERTAAQRRARAAARKVVG
jgi:Right handed beta helix region